jgi:ABC-2 type transport system ATP-binding protein
LLILDEPTSALDPSGVVLLRDLVAELATAGAALLVSSHHFDEVARVADRVSVVHSGRVVGELDPAGHDLERTFFAMVQEADARGAA